jgi:hypothetical protein
MRRTGIEPVTLGLKGPVVISIFGRAVNQTEMSSVASRL